MEKVSPARLPGGLNPGSTAEEHRCPKCESSEVVGDYCTQCHVRISMYLSYLRLGHRGDSRRLSGAAILRSRPLMFAASSLWVAAILMILVFRGGGAIPVEPRPADLLAQQAASSATAGDYDAAARLYRKAILETPEDVSLWYSLGLALSHLNQRRETVEAFQFVVRRGSPNSDQVKAARQWLMSATEAADLPVPAVHGESGDMKEGTSSQESWM